VADAGILLQYKELIRDQVFQFSRKKVLFNVFKLTICEGSTYPRNYPSQHLLATRVG